MEIRPLPFTVYPSRAKLIWLLLMSVTFTVGGVWLALGGEAFGWVCAAFFGLGTPLFAFQLFRPKSSSLTIDDQGFEFVSLSRKKRFAWNEISDFGIYSPIPRLRFQSKFVAFNFSPEYKESPKIRATAKAVSGFDSQLPDTYGFSAEELAELLTHYLVEKRATA